MKLRRFSRKVDRVERWRVLWPEERALLRKAISVATNAGSGFGWPDNEMERLDVMYRELGRIEEGPRRRVVGLHYEETSVK